MSNVKSLLIKELHISLQSSLEDILEEITCIAGSIRDPERSQTLEELFVIDERSVKMEYIGEEHIMPVVTIFVRPTVPHCHLMQQIGLAIRLKLMQELPQHWLSRLKIILRCMEGTHNQSEEIEKQLNDKERVAAALENEQILEYINKLID